MFRFFSKDHFCFACKWQSLSSHANIFLACDCATGKILGGQFVRVKDKMVGLIRKACCVLSMLELTNLASAQAAMGGVRPSSSDNAQSPNIIFVLTGEHALKLYALACGFLELKTPN